MAAESLSVTQYAKSRGITRQAVLKRIKNKKVKAKKVGNIWVLTVKKPS